MIHGLVDENFPLLYEEMEKFDFANPPTDPIKLATDLADTMLANNGLGLAANQIGLPYRAFAMKSEQIIVCFNPLIVDTSSENILLEEGCLSFPGLFIKVKRPKSIKVRYTQPNGEIVNKMFGGITARIFQHELAHLNGFTMLNEATRFHIEQARKDKKLRDRKSKRLAKA